MEIAPCFRNYDENFAECRVHCGINNLCKVATKNKQNKFVPPKREFKPKYESVSSLPEPSPFLYFKQMLKGKGNLKENIEISNDRVKVFDLYIDENPFARIMIAESDNKVLIQQEEKKVFDLNSISDAENILKKCDL